MSDYEATLRAVELFQKGWARGSQHERRAIKAWLDELTVGQLLEDPQVIHREFQKGGRFEVEEEA